MAEILSQSQIDELLNELSGDVNKEEVETELDEKVIKNYDFKSPKKMSRDQYKALSGMTDVLARHLAAYFAGILRNACEIELATIDEHPYFEYNNSLPDSLITAVIDIDSINGTILMDMSNSITYALVERMLGGSLESAIIPDREFTEIEIALMERVFKKICMFIEESFVDIPNTKVKLNQIETNTRFIKAIRIEEVVEVIVYNVSIGSINGTITICAPYTCVDSVLSNLENINKKAKTGIISDEAKREMLSELSNTFIDVCAELGTVNLPLKEVMNFQPGDVIKLDKKVGNPVLVTVNGNKWFLAEPGINKSYKAVRINKYYKGRSNI